MIPYSSTAGLAVTLGLAAIVSAILIWINPSSRRHLPENWESYDLEKIREKYRDLAEPGMVLELLLAFALILPLSFGLVLLQNYLLAPKVAGTIHFLSNSLVPYTVPALFLGFILGGFLAQYLLTWRVRSRGTPEEFAIWRYDWERNKPVGNAGGTVSPIVEHPMLMGGFIVILVFVTFVAFFAVMDNYTLITPERIVTNHVFGFHEDQYTFDEVDQILDIDQTMYFVIIFKDGSYTDTDDWMVEPPLDRTVSAVNYISARSGVPIQKGIWNPHTHVFESILTG